MSQFGLNFCNEIAAGSRANALVAPATIRRLRIPFSHLAERGADDRESRLHVAHHERCLHAHDAVAKPSQLLIPAAISRTAAAMHAAVHLDYQPDRRAKKSAM
jgi:hypothetical protein